MIEELCNLYSSPNIIRMIKSKVYWSEFLSTDLEVPGSIPSATRFSEKYWIWNGVHSAS
jgi:hypothetical protein